MTGLHLTLRQPLPGRWDASQLGGGLAGLPPEDVASLRLSRLGSRLSVAVGQQFDVQAAGERGSVTISGDLRALDGLASGWQGGHLLIQSDVGNHFARGQRGGAIELCGNAGDGVAQQMSGGRLLIHGSVGDDLAGPLPGHRSGMRGGMIVVQGNAGNAAGYRLRRGTLLVLGNVGDYCGGEMVAGTVLVGGTAGRQLGHGMRRGTIVVGDPVTLDSERFPVGQVGSLEVAKLIAAEVQSHAPQIASGLRGTLQRYWGDRLAGGQGEIWRIEYARLPLAVAAKKDKMRA